MCGLGTRAKKGTDDKQHSVLTQTVACAIQCYMLSNTEMLGYSVWLYTSQLWTPHIQKSRCQMGLTPCEGSKEEPVPACPNSWWLVIFHIP